jgi:hypothetical protein
VTPFLLVIILASLLGAIGAFKRRFTNGGWAWIAVAWDLSIATWAAILLSSVR